MSLKSEHHNIAIVGINHETATLFPLLLDTQGVRIVLIINHERQNLACLAEYPDIDVIIDTTNDSRVASALRALNLENADIVGALSARIFFLTGKREILGHGAFADHNGILNSLHEIRQAVLLSRNKEELLKLILNVAIRSVAADTGSIMLLDAEKRYLTIEIADGIAPEIVTSTIQKIGKGIAGRVVRSGKPLLLSGTVDEEDGATGRHLVSSICCPLLIGPDPVGAISVNSATPGKEFGEHDLVYIKQLADFTADIIRTSKEFERNSLSQTSLSIAESARNILSLTYPFDERLNLLLMRVANSLGGDICNYYRFCRDDNTFYLKSSSSFKFELIRGKRLKLNAQLAGKVLDSRDTVCIDVPDGSAGRRKWFIAEPVRINNELAGLLFYHFAGERSDARLETETVGRVARLLSSELSRDMRVEDSNVKSEKLSAISEASFDLANARSLEELAQVVVTVACLVLEAESCVLRVKSPRTGKLEVLDSFSLRSSAHYRAIQDIDGGISKEAFKSGKVLAIDTAKELEKYGAKGLCKSVLSMCLLIGDRKFGTITLYDKNTVDLFGSSTFSRNDRDIFLSMCLQAAKALQRFIPESITSLEPRQV